jgi:hypothetical protein
MTDEERAEHLRDERIYRDSQAASLQLQINELGRLVRMLEKNWLKRSGVIAVRERSYLRRHLLEAMTDRG